MFHAGSGVCRQQTDSNDAAKVGRLVPSARKANLNGYLMNFALIIFNMPKQCAFSFDC
jgi:hypothetical protein